jgi:hypothetical protein
MKAYVVLKIPGGTLEQLLWAGNMYSAPRPNEFLSINPDDASYIVDRVEWDCSRNEAEITVFVK